MLARYPSASCCPGSLGTPSIASSWFLPPTDQELDQWARRIEAFAATWRLTVAVLAAVAAATLAAGRVWLVRYRHRLLTANARLVTVLAPPEVKPAAGPALWAHLMGLLRPAWARLIFGQPHLVWEYTWTRAGMRVAMWVPGVGSVGAQMIL
jgi:hypothetical protein